MPSISIHLRINQKVFAHLHHEAEKTHSSVPEVIRKQIHHLYAVKKSRQHHQPLAYGFAGPAHRKIKTFEDWFSGPPHRKIKTYEDWFSGPPGSARKKKRN